MYRGHTVGVVIPAYNEEGLVGRTLEGVPSFVDRVYVVDDGSTDGTLAEIRETASRLNEAFEPAPDGPRRFTRRVVPIEHEENRGVGGAIKTGYRHAREDGMAVTTVMGGDDQMEPEMLDALLDPIVEGRADYTKGNRFLNRTDRDEMPAFRFVGNAVLSGLTKMASGYWTTGDPQSGYTAISLEALERADIDGMYEFYGYCNDLLVKLNVAGLRVLDVPRPVTYGEEESHIDYSTYIPKVSGMLLRNFLWRMRTKYLLFDFHPLVFAYAVGALATLAGGLGVVAGAAALAGATVPGLAGGGAAAALGSSLLVGLLGVLSTLWAMTLDMDANAALNGADRRTGGTRRGRRADRTGRDAVGPVDADAAVVSRRGARDEAAGGADVSPVRSGPPGLRSPSNDEDGADGRLAGDPAVNGHGRAADHGRAVEEPRGADADAAARDAGTGEVDPADVGIGEVGEPGASDANGAGAADLGGTGSGAANSSAGGDDAETDT
ncbi:glycosyltransferase family 2 protein [Halorarum halobium]|uniref:glycosyltransferase family 2 protein n=1 Tax=Halorarum halobium TaxID=3075121 RepID=UPI0028A774CC|nr:glycosyltransferase family 2 protein [Halobaculum sp. XH14]